ncbi:MAG TPA: LLM class flavin-dependent oxidoreductase [Acidimicrobiales bacterium]|nr:LLM class flavin-dependent oxidoreductase [Acidimicrobiales bacterium]
MEFGVFLNGYIPGPAAHVSDLEHTELMREAEYVIFADKHNWKYAWLGEHHALTEYSHLSAPEVVMGYIAAQTDYIHLCSGITSLSPRKEHPARFAERAAMLDHFTDNRFEFGTGRGAGSHEIALFNILDKNSTKPEWEEVVREIPRMWEQVDYEYQGEHFTVPYPHNVLPKPYGKGHPPIWVACGNPPTFTRAGELGIGAIAFNFEPIYALRGRIEAYKEGASRCTEPLGQFKNDNVMITNSVLCFEDRARAREAALRKGRGYLVSMVNLYHDTMPKSQDAITWPDPPISIRDMAGDDPEGMLDGLIEGGYMLCGTPDEVAEQITRWGDVGMDQLVFGLPIEGLHHDEVLEVLELFGDKVIPEFDSDRKHSTSYYREQAKPKYDTFSHPLPDVAWPQVLPVSALKQL